MTASGLTLTISIDPSIADRNDELVARTMAARRAAQPALANVSR